MATSCVTWGFMAPAAVVTTAAFVAWGLVLIAFVVTGHVIDVGLFVIVLWVPSCFILCA